MCFSSGWTDDLRSTRIHCGTDLAPAVANGKAHRLPREQDWTPRGQQATEMKKQGEAGLSATITSMREGKP